MDRDTLETVPSPTAQAPTAKVPTAKVPTTLTTRFNILLAAVILVASLVFVPWCVMRQGRFSEDKALAEARTLHVEMQAAWDYISDIQDRINYDATGRYDFKGVYCSLAGKAIAQRFMQNSEYEIGYVREQPRSATNSPDEFESRALAAFASDGVSEYYGMTETEDGRTVFRYVTALYYDYTCLTCHGSPAGEKDESGYLKEGKATGDLAGAASIAIPMSVYRDEIALNALTDMGFFIVLLLVVVGSVGSGVRLWVRRPLRGIAGMAGAIGRGSWDVSRELPRAPREFADLGGALGEVAGQLKASYESLEEKVERRTSELVVANERLDVQRVQIEQAYSALQEANERLEAQGEYKSQFFSTMSHELKTPIASIRASLDIWSKSKETLDEADKVLSEEACLQCDALLDMVENALGTCRVETGRFVVNIQEIDPVDVVDEVCASIEVLARRKDIGISCYIDPRTPIIRSDWAALRRILCNFASNAVKFTPDGGSIRFSATYLADMESVVFEVADTGIGIAPADQQRVFERFRQVDSSLARGYHGSGLGLSLARDLADCIGAAVSLESELGRGSVFRLTVPVGSPADPGATDPGATDPGAIDPGEIGRDAGFPSGRVPAGENEGLRV